MTEKTNTILVHCGSCKNQWLGLPQSTLLRIVAEMMEKMVCPWCAEPSSNIFCGPAPEEKEDDR
jgi:hypothetical protein